jgi:hypothetical protein
MFIRMNECPCLAFSKCKIDHKWMKVLHRLIKYEKQLPLHFFPPIINFCFGTFIVSFIWIRLLTGKLLATSSIFHGKLHGVKNLYANVPAATRGESSSWSSSGNQVIYQNIQFVLLDFSLSCRTRFASKLDIERWFFSIFSLSW